MADFSSEPIEPTGSSRLVEEAEGLLWDVYDLSRVARVLCSVFMLMMAWSCLWGAYAITQFHHWVAWAFSIVLLRASWGLAALCSGFTELTGANLGRGDAGAIRRAQFGLLALLFVMSAFVTARCVVAWETYKHRGVGRARPALAWSARRR